MDFTIIIPLLSLVMLLGVLVFAVVSTTRVEEQRQDPKARKSPGQTDNRSAGQLDRTGRRPYN